MAVTWPAGIARTSYAYIWRTTPLHRREIDGSASEDLPPDLPSDVALEQVQRPQDGTGPLLRRTYGARIAGGELSASELMARLSANPDQVAPRALAKFRKTAGHTGRMQVGDEFLVHMPGPWDGPVRTIHVDACSFRFATLDGHLEAGQIEWRARDETGGVRFEIESWARMGDWFSAIAHDRLRMAKEVQLHMWISVIERVVRLCGGRLDGGIDIETRRLDGSIFD